MAVYPKTDKTSSRAPPFLPGGGVVRNMAATADGRVYIACSGVNKLAQWNASARLLPCGIVLRAVEDAMNATAAKPKEQLCQAVSHVDEPCDQSAQQHCARCGQWYCRAHFPDPDWHPCAPEQGAG